MNRNLLGGAVAAALLAAIGFYVIADNDAQPDAQGKIVHHKGVRSTFVNWEPGEKPAMDKRTCREADVVLSPEALDALGLEDGRVNYAHVRECAAPNAGLDFSLVTDTNPDVLQASIRALEYDPQYKRIEVWLARATKADAGEPFAPHDCACGPGCDMKTITDAGEAWVRSPAASMVHQRGQWRASGSGACVPHPCVALAGIEPEAPEECQ